MQRMNLTSIFINHEQLRDAAKKLRQEIDDYAFKPDELPDAVMRLEVLHQKILQQDVSELKKRQNEKSANKQAALGLLNQFLHFGRIDKDRLALFGSVPQIKDLQDYLLFLETKKSYVAEIKACMIELKKEHKKVYLNEFDLSSNRRDTFGRGWHEHPAEKQLKSLLWNVDAADVLKTEDFYLQQYAQVAKIVVDSAHPQEKWLDKTSADFLDKYLRRMQALRFAMPVPVAAPVSSMSA